MNKGTKNRRVKWIAAVCAVMVLCGCMQAEELPQEENSLPVQPDPQPAAEEVSLLPDRFSLPYEPDETLDPYTCPDGTQQTIGSLLYEGLFRLNERMEPETCLCDSYSANGNYTFYTIVLRNGVLFSDGSPLTAEEVRAALERAAASPRYQARLSRIARMTAAGDTLTITLTGSDSGFPALLDVPICKGEGSVPLGTGPYYFNRDGGAHLEANPLWRQSGTLPTDRIWLEEAQGAVLYRFVSRDVQLMTANLTASSPVGITGEIRYQDVPTTAFQYVVCNTARPPLNSAAFRRALSVGINRETLVNGLLSGHALPTQFPVSPASALYPADLERTYSLNDFAAALAESGYYADRPLTLLVNGENRFKVSMAQAVAQGLSNGGVQIEIRELPWEEYQAAAASGDFDLCYTEARLTADWSLSPLLASWGALNIGGWTDDGTMLSLLESFAAASDRVSAMRAVCARFREEAPILPVCFSNSSVLMQADVVENLRSTAAEPFYNLTECVIHLRQDEDREG